MSTWAFSTLGGERDLGVSGGFPRKFQKSQVGNVSKKPVSPICHPQTDTAHAHFLVPQNAWRVVPAALSALSAAELPLGAAEAPGVRVPGHGGGFFCRGRGAGGFWVLGFVHSR